MARMNGLGCMVVAGMLAAVSCVSAIAENAPIRLATFNIRCPMDKTPNSWEERAARVKDFVKRFKWKGPVFEISALTGIIIQIACNQNQGEFRRGLISIFTQKDLFQFLFLFIICKFNI